jgi:GNAT superfamily N-acetyltransferase
MTCNIKISKAAITESEEILRLQKIAFITEGELYNNFNIEPLTQTIDSIKSDFSSYTFLKAEVDDKIIGSVKAIEKNGACSIGKLFVIPEFRNKGIGKMLMQGIEKEFSNALKYEIFTGSKSEHNIKFYASLGYNAEDTIPEKNTPIRLVVMAKYSDIKK